MRGYILAGVIMAGLLLFPGQIRAEDHTAVETEGTVIRQEDSIIIPEEDIAFDVLEPDYPEDEEAGITEEFFSGAGLIEEGDPSETLPAMSVTSFEEGGEILLDDPMTVENEIIRGGRNEILLLSRDDQAMRYGSSYTGLFADQLQPDSRDFYDGMAGYYALEEGNGSWTRTYRVENAPASFHTLFYPSGDSYTFIRTDDNGEYTEEYSSFLEDTAVVVQSAIDAFEYDYPDVFWIRPKSFRYGLTLVADEESIGTEQVTGTVYVTEITYVPEETFPGAHGYLSEYKAGKERILDEIRQTADYDGDGTITPSEHILADHDYLTSLLWYDAERYRNRKKTGDYSILTPAQTYIGSFRHGAVCEGYAKSFKSLCDAQGITCCLIGGSGHMWNGVSLNGEWHLIDCTWDDDEDGYSHDYLMTGKDSVHSSSGNFSNSSHTTIFCYPQLSGSIYHDYVLTKSTPALCTEAGSSTYTCLICGDSYLEEVAPFGHEYVKNEKHATCTQEGSITYTCIRCGDSWSEETPAQGHDYEESMVSPTCMEDGYTRYTCSRCNDTYRTDIQKASGHDYAACKKESVPSGYRFQIEDFVVTEHYSDGSCARAAAFSVSVETKNGMNTINVTEQGFQKTLYVPCIPETGGGEDPGNEAEETVKVSVSLNPATVNVGETLSDGQLRVSLTDAKTGQSLGQTKEYTTDFTPQMKEGDYPFHVTCRGITLTVRAVIVDPSQSIQSISVSYNGPHGKYLVMEEGVDPACLNITAVMGDGSSRSLTSSEVSVSSVEMAAYDGGMTKVHLILMGKTTGLAQIPSYHKDSLTGESSLQKNCLSSDGEYHVKPGQVFDKNNLVFTAKTYGGDTACPDFTLVWIENGAQTAFGPKTQPGTYQAQLTCQGRTWYTFQVIVDPEN